MGIEKEGTTPLLFSGCALRKIHSQRVVITFFNNFFEAEREMGN